MVMSSSVRMRPAEVLIAPFGRDDEPGGGVVGEGKEDVLMVGSSGERSFGAISSC